MRGEHRAVGEGDEAMDDRLRVDRTSSRSPGMAEEMMRLDHFEALVHQRRGVDA